MLNEPVHNISLAQYGGMIVLTRGHALLFRSTKLRSAVRSLFPDLVAAQTQAASQLSLAPNLPNFTLIANNST